VRVDSKVKGTTTSHLYAALDADTAARVATEHLQKGQPVKDKLCSTEQSFFKAQVPIVLENSGRVDPERIESYIAAGGYEALLKAITEMTPATIIQEITASGLRGRGGGGYPTGLKWSTVSKSRGTKKYVICNADEGDPGAYMNRILESGFNFRVDLRIGAGAFVCGEETALIASIEGKRGAPRPRPPYPAERGLWGQPTLINNVETFANIAPIVLRGGAWYASIGTAKSKGTKVFALAGKIVNTGLIEVPMGIPLREIIFDIGGGIPDGRKFKAAQTGGPSGGCIPAAHLDLPVDYESLAAVGSIMGSGGLIVMDDTSCMVDVAKFFMDFCRDESCGKCVPCRTGTVQMFDLLNKITSGRAALADLEMLEELADLLRNTSLCGLGQTAPNPVVSTLQYFRDEYMAHIVDKRCPAGVCRMDAAHEAH
jgi:bidirectional [NiFe] hydrogenase diaphorase subunit